LKKKREKKGSNYNQIENVMKAKYLLLVVAVFFSFSFLSCDKEEGDDNSGTREVEYRVTSSVLNGVDKIEYTPASGVMDVDVLNPDLPWSISFEADLEFGDVLNLNIESAADGLYTGQILIDGDVVEEETGEGFTVLAYLVD
jgi:hypothetical protein